MRKKKQGLKIHNIDEVIYRVSANIYLNKENNFLKNLKKAKYVIPKRFKTQIL